MSNQPAANDKDQFPHVDVANNEEGGPPGHEKDRRSVPADAESAKKRTERGNTGPAEEPGFGQGA